MDMDKHLHPMRKLNIKTYTPDQHGELYVAYIGSIGGKASAVHFTGKTRDEAHDKAVNFKNGAIKTHEAAYAARALARAKAKTKTDSSNKRKVK